MKEINKELQDKIAKRYLEEGFGYGAVASRMHMKPDTFESAVRKSATRFTDRTFSKLVAYSEGKSWNQIIKISPKYSSNNSSDERSAISDKQESTAEINNIQVLLSRISALESLTTVQNETISLLREEVKTCMKDREANNRKVDEAMENIETMDKRQQYVSRAVKTQSEDINRLRIKIEPTKFNKK